jgi:Glycosyl transferase family 2
MTRPAVSVVLWTWNRAPLVDAAIRALAEQGSPPHEILVVDKGSTNATRDIVMRAAARHPAIQYLHEPDAWDALRQTLAGRTVEAFEHETRLWFVASARRMDISVWR